MHMLFDPPPRVRLAVIIATAYGPGHRQGKRARWEGWR